MRWTWLLLVGLIPVVLAANASIVTQNGTVIPQLFYDRGGSVYNSSFPSTYGADAYLDRSPTNPNAYLHVCMPDLAVGDRVDLRYVSQAGNLSWSALNYKPRVTSVYNASGENCSLVDVDLSSIDTLYPGYLTPYVLNGSGATISNFTNLSTFLNGSFDIGIEVQGPPKQYYITVDKVRDQNGTIITRSQPQLVTSIVEANGSTVKQAILAPGNFLLFDGSFKGGESIWVNGIESLKVKVYQPCDPLNKSGYYILNQSKNNYNATCVRITNATNIVLNFVGEQIDGDNSSTGSMRPNTCPIDVRNSRGITFENLKTSQYRYGICIHNSSVQVYGTASTYHDTGALVDNRSNVLFADTIFNFNRDEDINVSGNSTVRLYEDNFSTARINSTFHDAIVKPVPAPPPPPNVTGIKNISQWIRYDSNGNDAWAQISFKYGDPLPNGAVIDNVSLFKYDGVYTLVSNGTSGPNGTNATGPVYNWTGVWTQLYTLVSPQKHLIIGPNVSNFSIFAPYAFESNQEKPQPKPQPQPQPQPQAGSGGGSGGTPTNSVPQPQTNTFPQPVELKLELPKNVTLHQGEAGQVPFNLSNVGKTPGYNISIQTEVPLGWQTANYTLAQLDPGQNVSSTYPLAVDTRAVPREYYLPVDVYVSAVDGTGPQRVLRQVLKVIVLPRGDLYRMKLLEYPPVIRMPPNSKLDVSFLAQNIGDNALTGVTIVQDPSPCLTGISGSNDLGLDEQKSLTYTFRSAGTGVCDYIIKFKDSQGTLVGFVPVTFYIQSKPLISNPLSFSILLIILLAWTVLTVWVIRRRRY